MTTPSRAANAANQVMARQRLGRRRATCEFLNDPAGRADRVKVTVCRTAARGNPVSTLIAKYFGIATADIGATATAEASPANAMTCVKPFTIPDKWREARRRRGTATIPTTRSTTRATRSRTRTSTFRPIQPGYTGYNQETRRGQRLMIRAATGQQHHSQLLLFARAREAGITGGAEYRWNIANCNTTIYHWEDPLTQEPGTMAGPTIQGADDLIAKDPGAYWDTATNKVKGSAYGGQSPRVFPIPLYDPIFYDSGKRNGRNAI